MQKDFVVMCSNVSTFPPISAELWTQKLSSLSGLNEFTQVLTGIQHIFNDHHPFAFWTLEAAHLLFES